MRLTLGGRVSTLVGACLAAFSTGTIYVGSLYAPQLSERLRLTSKEVNTILFCANVGVYLGGVPLGYLVDRYGARLPMVGSAMSLAAGYALMKYFYDGGLGGPFAKTGLVPLCIFQLLIGIGSTGSYAGASNAVAKSFTPQRRGTALSICIACLGLSAFIYSLLSSVKVMPGIDSTSSFFALLATTCGISVFIAAFLVRSSSALSSAIPIGVYSPLPDEKRHDSTWSASSFASPKLREDSLAMPIDMTLSTRRRTSVSSPKETASPATAQNVQPVTAPPKDISGVRLFLTVDFWLLFVYLGLLTSCGLMFINNLGTIVHSISLPKGSTKTAVYFQHRLVAILSLSSCFGRLTYGPLSDLAQIFHVDRAFFMLPNASLFVASSVWISQVKSMDNLIGATVLTGFSYGCMASSVPVLILDWFGLPSFSMNSGILSVAPAIFGAITSVTFGIVYDSHVSKNDAVSTTSVGKAGDRPDEHQTCKAGNLCFRDAFFVTAGLAALAMGLAVVAISRRKGRRVAP